MGPIIGALLALLLTEFNLILLSVTIKKVLVGRDWGVDHATPFWSLRHFAYFFAQDCFFVWCQGPLNFCAGTILANPILRWMGCRIGQRTIVTEPMQCSDWNAVRFDDDCVVGGFLQFHTFENMMLKVKQTHIQNGCTISFGATVMSGVVMERDTTVLPLSLVLKEMDLSSASYQGSPVEPVARLTDWPGITVRMTWEASARVNDLFAANVCDCTPAPARGMASVLFAPVLHDRDSACRCASVLSDAEKRRAQSFLTKGGEAHFKQQRAFRRYCGGLAVGSAVPLSRIASTSCAAGTTTCSSPGRAIRRPEDVWSAPASRR